MQWGKYVKRFEALSATGEQVKALETLPEVRLDLIPAWDAFIELHNRRQFGFDANPISMTDLHCWMDINGVFDLDARQTLYRLVSFLDNSWLSLHAKEAERKAKKAKGKQEKRPKNG